MRHTRRLSPGLVDEIRADFAAAFPHREFSLVRAGVLLLLEPGWEATVVMRLQLAAQARHHTVLARLLRARNIRRNGMDVQLTAVVGPSVTIRHPNGILIGQSAIIGARCWIGSGVVVGRRTGVRSPDAPSPTHVGDDVTLGSHAMVFGPITLGAGAVVGAGSVLLQDVPSNTVVSGVPAVPIGRQPAPQG